MGESGSGKSGLGLALMGLGCQLVSDDRTVLQCQNDHLSASPPPAIAGLIEARNIGILSSEYLRSAQVKLAVDLDQISTARMPQRQFITLLGYDIPLIWRVEGAHFAPAILQLLKFGWSDR